MHIIFILLVIFMHFICVIAVEAEIIAKNANISSEKWLIINMMKHTADIFFLPSDGNFFKTEKNAILF